MEVKPEAELGNREIAKFNRGQRHRKAEPTTTTTQRGQMGGGGLDGLALRK